MDKNYKKLSLERPNEIICGEVNDKGICDTYRNGEKTGVQMLVFNEEQADKLLEVMDKINKPKVLPKVYGHDRQLDYLNSKEYCKCPDCKKLRERRDRIYSKFKYRICRWWFNYGVKL